MLVTNGHNLLKTFICTGFMVTVQIVLLSFIEAIAGFDRVVAVVLADTDELFFHVFSVEVKIGGQKVLSEGIAAFYDAMMSHDGTYNASIQQIISRRPVAVVDMGGKTLDIAVVIENVRGVYGERSGTADIGVLSLITKIASRLKSKFEISNDVPSTYVEEACRTKMYEFFGEMHDVSEIIETACREYLSEVKNFFVAKVGDGSDLGAAIFVGGGAALIRSALGDEAFAVVFRGKCLVADQAEYANARGMWKYVNFIMREEDRSVDVPDTEEAPMSLSKVAA